MLSMLDYLALYTEVDFHTKTVGADPEGTREGIYTNTDVTYDLSASPIRRLKDTLGCYVLFQYWV